MYILTNAVTAQFKELSKPTKLKEPKRAHNQKPKEPITITKIFSLKSPTKNPKEPIWARGPRYGQHWYILLWFIIPAFDELVEVEPVVMGYPNIQIMRKYVVDNIIIDTFKKIFNFLGCFTENNCLIKDLISFYIIPMISRMINRVYFKI